MANPYTFKSGSFVLAAGATAYKGGMMCINTAAVGSVVQGQSGISTLKRIGLFTEDNNNSASGSTSTVMGTLDFEIAGQWFNNATGGSAITASGLYGPAYIVDDNTVGSSGSASAGTVWALDAILGVAVVPSLPFS
jgi:hypothetical protein